MERVEFPGRIIVYAAEMVMGVVYALQDVKWAGEIILDQLKNSHNTDRQRFQRHRWPDLT